MFWNKSFQMSDYLNYQDLNDLTDKVKELYNNIGTSKNLWGGFNFSKIHQGVNYTYYKDGKIKTNGTATSGSYSLTRNEAYNNGFYKILTPGTYTLSGGISSSKRVQVIRFYNDNIGTEQLAQSQGSKATFTIQEEALVYIRVYIVNGTVVDDVFNIQLEKGSTATEYEPHWETTFDNTMKTFVLNDFPYVEDIDKIERNIMQLGYDFMQPPGYIQNRIWKDSNENVYKTFSYQDINRMITDINLLYEYRNDTSTKFNLISNENWNGSSTLEWEE